MWARSHAWVSGDALVVMESKEESAERTKCTVPAVSAHAVPASAHASMVTMSDAMLVA